MGMEYAGARFYSSRAGRWASVDPELGNQFDPPKLNGTPTSWVIPSTSGIRTVTGLECTQSTFTTYVGISDTEIEEGLRAIEKDDNSLSTQLQELIQNGHR